MATISKTRNTSKEGSVGKKRRSAYSESDDNASKVPYGKKNCELPFSKRYYNSFKSHLPAELFRKDLISAMKLADNEQLSPDDYWLISDTWKQEWEKGVQVPVNPDGLPESNVRVLYEKKKPSDPKNEFKLPKKLLKFSEDKNYSPDIHILTNAPARYLKVCSYDLDIVDIEWLKIMNEELKLIGLPCLTESAMELAMEKIENQCFCKLQEAIKTEEGLGIEFDDDVICDVCRSPDSEEGNEMVFCDACNVCVHQACYGITKIPEGSWICRSCALGIRPSCILCPNTGGAMKSTRSGQKWTHVSCALWIPEVAIENVDRMEPITKISEIPASRWALVCSLCREKVGACIQCSVRTCKTAYHVTCAFQHGLAMKAIIDDDEEEDDVDLKSYCLKHTKEKKGKASEDLNEQSNKKKNKKELEMSNEEKASARLARVKQMEAEFYRYVNIRDIARSLKMDMNVVDFIYQYWILKRKANFNKPLVIPKSKPLEPVENNPLNSLYARMKMFVHLRQDLERVRNLCYMVTKRERLSRSWCKIKHDIFLKQAEIVSNDSFNCKEAEKQAILNANHGDTIYDIMSSCDSSPKPSLNSILSALGEKSHTRKEDSVTPKHRKLSTTSSSSSSSLQRLPNPYAKQYSNSVVKRSQRLSTESYTEQDAKWKEMSENQKASHQKSKDIANKLAALQETYNLKPMEIVVDKLPDHGPSLQFSRFSKRTSMLSGKRHNRSSGSPEKFHSEPLTKRSKIRLSLRAKSTKHSSRTEVQDRISSDTNSAQLPQESVHYSHDHQTDFGNLTSCSEENEFNNDKKQIQVNSDDGIQNELHQHNDKNDILYEEQISEIDCHQSEQSYVNHEEGKDWQGDNFDSEKEINESSEARKCNWDNNANESCLDDNEEHLVMESTDVLQEGQKYSSAQEKGIVTNMTDCKISEINAHDNNYNVHSNYGSEIGIKINHKKENEHHQNETTKLSVEKQAQKETLISVTDHKDEVTKHINPNKSHLGTDAANSEENVVQMVYINNMVKQSEINHRKGDVDSILMYINNIVKETENNNKKVDGKVREKENEKHLNLDIIKCCQEDKVNSLKNELYHHSKIQKIENNDKCQSDCNEDGNKTGGHEEENEIEVNNHKKWEAEVSNHKKVENQYHYYKKEHEILKDVKVSVQRYNSENIEEKRSANTRFSNNGSFVNSNVRAENEHPLHERCEKSVAENAKDISFDNSSRSFQNDCVQESLSRKSEIREVQILKKSSLNQEAKRSGNVVNSRKILSYEQRLMNSKKLRKEDIIIPARPYVENTKQQKLTERIKLHRDGSKLSKKECFHKKPARLNKSPTIIKNIERNSNFRCSEGERTLCKKPENNLSIVKQHNRFTKDISRYTDKEMETQKINSKDNKSQEKLVSETVARENLNTENLKETHCKDIHSKNTIVRYNSSLNFSSSELFNKKLSPKPNMHKYNNVPEKLQCSPSSNNAHSPSTVSPIKDVASGKEKLRQESAKIRESLFSVSTCTSKSLSGYKIPKKSRTDSAEKTSVQSSQDTAKLSPLYGVCQIQQTESYPHNGYHTDRSFRGCKYNSRVRNGEQQTQEPKLLLKLSKGSNYSNTARWKNDSVTGSRRDSFCLMQNNNTFPSLSRNPHCDRSCVSTDSVMLPVASDAGGYWVSEDSSGNFIKHFTQNVQNGDYGLS